MSNQNQISERGLILHKVAYQYLTEAAEAATRLGAPEVTLETLPYYIHLFAADDFKSPDWWFGVKIERRDGRAVDHRALIAQPAAIAAALREVGQPRGRRGGRVLIEGDVVRFGGPIGAAEVRGRAITPGGEMIIHNADRDVAIAWIGLESLRNAMRIIGQGNDITLRVKRTSGRGVSKAEWELYAESDEGDSIHLLSDVKVPDEYRPIVGRYPAAALNTLLSFSIWYGLDVTFIEPYEPVPDMVLERFVRPPFPPLILHIQWECYRYCDNITIDMDFGLKSHYAPPPPTPTFF